MSAHDRWPPATTITGCSPNRAGEEEVLEIGRSDYPDAADTPAKFLILAARVLLRE
jgi:hypothetical protein